jgi:hypothetical protein
MLKSVNLYFLPVLLFESIFPNRDAAQSLAHATTHLQKAPIEEHLCPCSDHTLPRTSDYAKPHTQTTSQVANSPTYLPQRARAHRSGSCPGVGCRVLGSGVPYTGYTFSRIYFGPASYTYTHACGLLQQASHVVTVSACLPSSNT